jgi:hypothetical protein
LRVYRHGGADRGRRPVGYVTAFPELLCAAVLLGACARTTVTPHSHAASLVPMTAKSIFVGSFNGEFAREMHAAVDAELEKSSRYRVVETEAVADYVLSGSIVINTQLTTRMVATPPSGFVQLFSRASGTNVWQYTYRDQRTAAALVVPTARQQILIIARDFVAQLLRVAIPDDAGAKPTF